MAMPSIAEVTKFIFNHDKWSKEQKEAGDIAHFIEMVNYFENHHHLEEVPAIAELKECAADIVRAGIQVRIYNGLDVSMLVMENMETDTVRIPEAPFGRIIPLTQLFDWVIAQRGDVIQITVNPNGMTVETSYGHTVKLPGCEIYLGRLDEDGWRVNIGTPATS